MIRDPRINPKPGDILNDDPPASNLMVMASRGGHVRAERRDGPDRTFTGMWPIAEWRKDMADAKIIKVAT